MIHSGRFTKKQKKVIEDIFYEKRYRSYKDVINDLVEIGLKHISEFDSITLRACVGRPKALEKYSRLEDEPSFFRFKPNIVESIEQLKKQRDIKDYMNIIRILTEIGLKYIDELPNRTPNSSA